MRILILLLAFLAPLTVRAEPLTIFAAASLTDALKDVAGLWVSAGHERPRLSFASSSTLARQIAQGATVNLFASADEAWMNYLADRRLVITETRRDLLGNRLVLVVPSTAPRTVTIVPQFDLAGILGPGGRLALGDPAHVPAGLYASQALRNLGVWEQVAPRLARAADVRAALLFVERGEAPAGIVYATDAMASKGVAVAGTFPDETHDRITYPFAVMAGGDTPDARAFLMFLTTAEARDAFIGRGFRIE